MRTYPSGKPSMVDAAQRVPRPQLLVVEDEEDVQLLMRDVLTPQYDLAIARNGLDALLRLREYVPDLLVSDIMMPLLDGRTLLQRVRALPGCENLPVLIVSGLSDISDQKEALRLGANAYISKPFNFSDLLVKVEGLLAGSKATRMSARRVMTPNPSLDSPRAMIITEDMDLLDEISVLRAGGIELVPAVTGSLAVQLLPLARPSVLIIDGNSPRINGYKLLKLIRLCDTLRDLPVVFVTHGDPERDRVFLRACRVDHFIPRSDGAGILKATRELSTGVPPRYCRFRDPLGDVLRVLSDSEEVRASSVLTALASSFSIPNVPQRG